MAEEGGETQTISISLWRSAMRGMKELLGTGSAVGASIDVNRRSGAFALTKSSVQVAKLLKKKSKRQSKKEGEVSGPGAWSQESSEAIRFGGGRKIAEIHDADRAREEYCVPSGKSTGLGREGGHGAIYVGY